MTGIFDPETFLNTTLTAPTATAGIPFDEGEYPAVAKEPLIRNGEKDGKPWVSVDIQWTIDDAAQRAKVGREEANCRQSFFLDLTPDGISIDNGPGKNTRLGRLREAIGLNKPGEQFNFRMVTGKVAKVKVKNKMNGDDIYSEVVAVAPL